jgi:hypothetical protein
MIATLKRREFITLLGGAVAVRCAKRRNIRFRASCEGSVALSPVSAHKNAGISFGTRAMSERDRNPL